MTPSLSIRELDDQITIRRAATVDDYRACQEVQRRSWGITEAGYLVPIATMIGANLHGGLVLGAFLHGGEAVAMSFAFLGRVEGKLCLYSQLTGVMPAYQSRGLGLEIKLLQRQIADEEGIERITWAFDPLQAGNAHFNLTRLGASSRIYVSNMYGLRTDALNAGVPTDRLIAEWPTQGQLGVAVSADSLTTLPRLIQTEQGRAHEFAVDSGALRLISDSSVFEHRRILLEIPGDIAQLRQESPATAERWRAIVSQAFADAFAAGYRAVQFVRDDTSGKRRGFYVLERL
jgi:predicted GNAT superfamily acetyltransferase